ncbi:ABC transporter permease [Streptomyces sp. NPDC050636]|uniref:ABC transporter permease n=1 Tax=Streptomyces sp. NPDC050636 TaxID=3154510 RepID=UPI003442048B
MSLSTAHARKPSWLSGGLDLKKVLLEGRAFFALIAITVVFSLLSPNYFTADNLLVMSQHVALYAILAIGMLYVVLNGGIDLSVGSTVGLSGVIAGYLLQGVDLPGGGRAYPSVWVTIVCVLAVGALVGLINGLLISKYKVAPFVATLGMLYAARGVAMLITDGSTYPELQGSPAFGNTGFSRVGFDDILGLPAAVIVLAALAIVASVVLNKTVFGRRLYAAGGNERAAELSGIPVKKVKVQVYVFSGLCASIAGLILTSEMTSANPNSGQSYELTTIAAVVIGGASLMGGRGNIRGTLLGAFVIGFLADGLIIVGVSEYWQMVFKGAVIVLAVVLNAIQYRAKPRAKAACISRGGRPTTQEPKAPAPAALP